MKTLMRKGRMLIPILMTDTLGNMISKGSMDMHRSKGKTRDRDRGMVMRRLMGLTGIKGDTLMEGNKKDMGRQGMSMRRNMLVRGMRARHRL